ncbi:MAG: ABC transporter permease [bacterium]
MSIIESITTSLRVMSVNKTRTALTVLGIVIGMATVIIVYSAGEGMMGLLMDQVEAFGTDVIETEIKVPSNKQSEAGSETDNMTGLATGIQITSLTLDDMDDISKISNISDAYGAVMGQELATYRNESRKAFILGTTAGYVDIDASEVAQGRWFTDVEDKTLAQVAILGYKMAEKLFGNQDPIGKFVKIRKEKFIVIGIMEERGAIMYMDFDDYIYVPVRTLQKKVMGIDHIIYMVHKLKDLDLADDTAEQARWILRQNHDITDPNRDDFRVVTMAESIEMLNTMMGALTILLLAIVAISLVVGGVGIMNIMYVIVAERTAEIGLRKAVGATYKNIMWEFLIESILITLLGGVIGVIGGISLSYLMAVVARGYGLEWSFSIPIQAYIVSLSFSIAFGLIFGVYPARKAARMHPVEALRHE